MHVPCLSLGFSESRGRCETFSFNLHGKNAELGVNSICHSRLFSFEYSLTADGGYSAAIACLKEAKKEEEEEGGRKKDTLT